MYLFNDSNFLMCFSTKIDAQEFCEKNIWRWKISLNKILKTFPMKFLIFQQVLTELIWFLGFFCSIAYLIA